MIKTANSIDEVIDVLDAIVAEEIRRKSKLAYFPALYLKVTRRVRQGILNQEFEDNLRMEFLDVVFANRYIDAYIAFRNGRPLTSSWRVAFEAENKSLLILQHLLLGMNAHINLDLGIAASETMKNKELSAIHNDFNAINRLLSEMSDEVQNKITGVSPLLGLLDRLGGNSDTLLVNFSIELAREGAWQFANQYSHSPTPKTLAARDKTISNLGIQLIFPAGKLIKFLIKSVKMAENQNVEKVVRAISG